MPPDTNYGADGGDSFFVKHPLILGAIATVFLLAIPAIWFYNEINPTPESGSPNTESQMQEQAEAQKLLLQQMTEIDRLRQQVQVLPPIATTTIKNQIKSLDAARSQTTKQATTILTPKTLEQQIQELDALRMQAQ